MRQIKYFDNINILRGFAAISVLMFHLTEPPKWPEFPNSGLLLWFRYGGYAVDLFFVISGFVIAISFFQRAKETVNISEQSSFRKKFIFNRLARIAPLYFITSLIWIVFVNPNLIFDHLLKNLSIHLFFIHNLIPGYQFGINPPSWTLAVEVHFYLIMATLGARFFKSNTLYAAFVGILIALLARSMNFLEANNPSYNIFSVRLTEIFCFLDEFFIGLALAKFVISSNFKKLIQIPVFKKLLIATFLIGIIYLSQIFYYKYVTLDYKIIFYRTILGLNFASLILIFCMFEIKGIARKILSPLYYLGTISYGIYLWHFPILSSLDRLEPIPQVYFMTLVIFITIIFSSLSWHFLEKPIIEKIRNKISY